MSIVIMLFQAWILVVALGIDVFACSFGYGANKIKIPVRSVILINFTCSLMLGAGLFFGSAISSFLSENAASWIAFTILSLIGVLKIFDSIIKKFIRRHNGVNKEVAFSLLNLGFILKVYADPNKADVDDSKVLSHKEAAPLAIAVGFDGLTVGFGIGVGIAVVNAFLLVGLSLISDIIAVVLGCYLGNKIAQKTSLDLSWLSGAILIAIAVIGVL